MSGSERRLFFEICAKRTASYVILVKVIKRKGDDDVGKLVYTAAYIATHAVIYAIMLLPLWLT